MIKVTLFGCRSAARWNLLSSLIQKPNICLTRAIDFSNQTNCMLKANSRFLSCLIVLLFMCKAVGLIVLEYTKVRAVNKPDSINLELFLLLFVFFFFFFKQDYPATFFIDLISSVNRSKRICFNALNFTLILLFFADPQGIPIKAAHLMELSSTSDSLFPVPVTFAVTSHVTAQAVL